jgi:hypothetical protein
VSRERKQTPKSLQQLSSAPRKQATVKKGSKIKMVYRVFHINVANEPLKQTNKLCGPGSVE